MISVVSPVYGCVDALPDLVRRIDTVLSVRGEPFEVVLVNDGSPDGSWEVIQELSQQYPWVRGLSLARNFGQHPAILAGVSAARGDCIIVMDCDLQDPPEEIPRLLETFDGDYDVVVGLRKERFDSRFRKYVSSVFFKVLSWMIGSPVTSDMRNFGAYDRKVCDAIQQMSTAYHSFALAVMWSGFRRKEIPLAHQAREHGASSYSVYSMLKLALETILVHSSRPLKLIMVLGLLLAGLSLIIAAYLSIRYWVSGVSVQGWTSLIVAFLFGTGMTIGTVGTVGLYLGLMFDEVKRRPRYIVAERCGRASDNVFITAGGTAERAEDPLE